MFGGNSSTEMAQMDKHDLYHILVADPIRATCEITPGCYIESLLTRKRCSHCLFKEVEIDIARKLDLDSLILSTT